MIEPPLLPRPSQMFILLKPFMCTGAAAAQWASSPNRLFSSWHCSAAVVTSFRILFSPGGNPAFCPKITSSCACMARKRNGCDGVEPSKSSSHSISAWQRRRLEDTNKFSRNQDVSHSVSHVENSTRAKGPEAYSGIPINR